MVLGFQTKRTLRMCNNYVFCFSWKPSIPNMLYWFVFFFIFQQCRCCKQNHTTPNRISFNRIQCDQIHIGCRNKSRKCVIKLKRFWVLFRSYCIVSYHLSTESRSVLNELISPTHTEDRIELVATSAIRSETNNSQMCMNGTGLASSEFIPFITRAIISNSFELAGEPDVLCTAVCSAWWWWWLDLFFFWFAARRWLIARILIIAKYIYNKALTMSMWLKGTKRTIVNREHSRHRAMFSCRSLFDGPDQFHSLVALVIQRSKRHNVLYPALNVAAVDIFKLLRFA